MIRQAMIVDPWFFAAAIPAVLLAGVSKAGLGGAAGGLSVPLLALTVTPPAAVAIMLPILTLMDLMGLYAFRGKVDRDKLMVAIPAGLLGIALGALLFKWVDPRWVKGLLGIESVLFALQRLREGRAAWEGPPRVMHRPTAAGWSALAGFTSFVSHAGGPPMMQWMLPLRMDKILFVGTLTWFFAAINLAKWVPYGWLGLFDARNLSTSLALLPAVPVGYAAGLWMLRRIDPGWFVRLTTWLLLVTGVKLCWDAFL